jgi:transforming growth factor-beta-induced protein
MFVWVNQLKSNAMKRKFFSFHTLILALGVSVFSFTSCEKDDDPIVLPQSVVEIIVNSNDHNTLEAAVVAANLAGTLSGTGPFTVFAPTDAAFAALPEGTIPALLADPQGLLTDILKYHVVSGKAFSSDLSNGQQLMTLLGKDVTVTINSNGVFINDAKVSVTNIEAQNGIVHVIDAVLIPPVDIPATVVDIIVESSVHTTLETAVTAAGLVSALSGTGPFTVFAPTDDAFAALPAGLLNDLLADPTGALADVLKYHVVAAKAMSGDLSDGQEITTLLGDDVVVTINTDGVFINNAKVTIADIEAENGVVHVIDAVLVPMPATVVDIIVNSEVHTTLETAVIAADLVGALSGAGPFTVFAPTDDAFAALPAGLLNDLLADPTGALADVLKYHVVAAKAMSGSLSDGQEITTLLGDDVVVTINTDGVFINDAKVVVADIEAKNGVVHVIDAVLVPMPATVVDIIVNSEVHTTLETAVIAADLVGALSGAGPFTVFAPTDDAFAALPAGLLNDLLADPTGALADVLKYHVVAAKAMSGSLSDGQEITTLLGDDVVVTINTDGVFINDAKVVVADIEAKNGVVHVIDAVLVPMPATVVDIIVNSEVHTTLETAVIAAGLDGALSGAGPFTVFAPTDDAFAALPAGLLNDLLADPTGALADILKYHVVAAKAMSGSLSDGQEITTLLGDDVVVTINTDGVFINDAKVIIADIEAKNGVVHVIDAVLIPSL